MSSSVKKATKFLLIDHNILMEDCCLEFDLYSSTEDKKVKLFKLKNEPLTEDEIKLLDGEIDGLYVKEDEHPLYDRYFQNFLCISDEDHPELFLKKTGVVYSKATKVMNELFTNPEALGNAEKSKVVVNHLVDTVLCEHFTIKSLLSIAAHDYYTHTHSLNVAIYALSFGAFLEMEREALEKLGTAALLHDMGKSKVDAAIINKNGKLTDEEFGVMMDHPRFGDEIVRSMGIEDREILKGIRHHHEKMDGTGYPDALKADAIPKVARIVGICDIFDALTSRRSYKEPMTTFEALKLMKTNMSTHVDTDLLHKMIMMFR